MFPWYWMWAPQIHFPLSGSVEQDISPSLDWFFSGIKPEAGIGNIEKGIFEKASYGKQLGMILDVLIPSIDESTLKTKEAKKSLAELKTLQKDIVKVKADKRAEMEHSAVALLKKIETTDKAMLQRVIKQF